MTKAKFTKLKKFFTKFPTKKFSKGDIILSPNDKLENVYFIKSGFVRAYYKTPQGENTLNLFKPLFLLSVIHNLSVRRNDFYFEALTPLEVYVAPQVDFNSLLETDKEISSTVMEFFLNSLLDFFVNQSNIINGNATNKVASVLLQLTSDFGDTKKDKLVVNFPATHRIIANLIGLTRETTSVQMSKLQKLGVITTKRTQFTVNDLEKLKTLSQSAE